jgi:hypothetical protein
MAKANSNSANGNSVATGKKFSYKELLAKAMGTTPDKVTVSTDVVKGVDDLYKKSMDKINAKPDAGLSLSDGEKRAKERTANRTANEILAEVETVILERENSEDGAEDIEIIEVVPVKGKKVIAQNSAQAQKLLSKVAQTKEVKEEKKSPKAKVEPEPKEAPAPVVRTRTTTATPLSKMTVAQLKEMKGKISDVQLNKYLKIASKRDGVELTQVAPAKEVKEAPESKAPITRTRTNVSKPDVVADLISKGKAKENRATLNELLLKLKGMSLAKVEESAGHLDDKEVVDLIFKIKEAPAPESKGKEKAKPTASAPASKKANGSTPLSKMTMAELQEVKGTISDVQWNKYAKIASKREGGVAETIPTKGKAKTEVKEEKKVTRTRKITTALAPEKEVPNAQEIFKLAVDLYGKLGAFLTAFEGFVK